VAPVIQLHRIKMIVAEALAARFGSVEKAPPKERELRAARPRWRIAGRELDPLLGFSASKFVQRARRHAKLRLFRMWKLVDDLKVQPAAAFRPVAERVRVARWMLRL
jgi:hypothetical protein